MDILVDFPPDPELYAEPLRQAFPELSIATAVGWDEALAKLPETRIYVSAGFGLTPEIAAELPRLEWIHALISGTDHLLPALDRRPDVTLTSSRGMHGAQMAETAILHMLALSRDVVGIQRDRALRHWQVPTLSVLDTKTVAIVGLGTAGQRLALLCEAFGMTVVGVSRTIGEFAGIDRVVPREQLRDAAGQADFLVLTLPQSNDTRGIVSAEVLAAMKPTAYVVNVARGGVVDEEALIRALRERRIAGAGLDVTLHEPLAPDSPLWDLDNVFWTPHIAGRSDRYHLQALEIFEPNLHRYLAGDRDEMINVVRRGSAS